MMMIYVIVLSVLSERVRLKGGLGWLLFPWGERGRCITRHGSIASQHLFERGNPSHLYLALDFGFRSSTYTASY